MNRRRSLPMFVLAMVSLGSAGWSYAEEDPFAFTDEEDPFALTDEAPVPDPERARLDLSIGYVSSDNFQFSRFQDFTDEGFFLSASGRLQQIDEDEALIVDILDAGLDTRRLDFSYASRHQWSTRISYSESVNHLNDTGFTPYTAGQGTGDQNLVLPSGWTGGINTGDFSGALINREISNGTRRKRLEAQVSQRFGGGLKLTAGFDLEERKGTVLKGMAIYSNAANPQAVMLPAPVDEESSRFSVTADWQSERLAASSTATFLSYDNKFNLVTWQHPYTSGLGTAVDYPAGTGGYVPAPDHDSYSLTLASAYRLADSLLLTVDAMTSETEQQDVLQAYTVNTGLPVTEPLGPITLDQPLETNMLNVQVKGTPFAKASVRFRYRYTERNNSFDELTLLPVPGDGFSQQTGAIRAQALDLEKDRYTLEGGYRLPDRTRISLKWDFEETFRSHAAVTDTEEDTVTLKVTSRAMDNMTHRLEVAGSELHGSTYQWSRSFFQRVSEDVISRIPDDQRWSNHPLLRQYHLADQDQVNVSWHSTWTPDDRWVVQATASGATTRFERSELGLTDVESRAVNLNAQYTASEDLDTWVWLDWSHNARQQNGRDFGGGINKPANRIFAPLPEGSDPARNYTLEQDTRTRSAGAGIQWRLSGQLELKSHYTLVVSDETIHVSTGGARDLAGTHLPDVEYLLHQLETKLNYQLDNGLAVTLEHRYFRYRTDNWAYDIATGELDKLLNTGLQNPDEVVNLFALGVSYRF